MRRTRVKRIVPRVSRKRARTWAVVLALAVLAGLVAAGLAPRVAAGARADARKRRGRLPDTAPGRRRRLRRGGAGSRSGSDGMGRPRSRRGRSRPCEPDRRRRVAGRLPRGQAVSDRDGSRAADPRARRARARAHRPRRPARVAPPRFGGDRAQRERDDLGNPGPAERRSPRRVEGRFLPPPPAA